MNLSVEKKGQVKEKEGPFLSEAGLHLSADGCDMMLSQGHMKSGSFFHQPALV